MAAPRNAPTRQDTWAIRCSLNGNTLGVWDKKTGGAVDSDDGKYYPGDMAEPLAIGGRKTTDNVTLQRFYDLHDDHDKINLLFNAAGRGNMVISQRPLDQDGNPYGKPIIYHGKLKRVLPPETDSESGTVALIEIEVTINGFPSAV